MKAHTLFIFLLLLTFFLKANENTNYYFRHINTQNGLSQNTVLSILQDQTGFMWFGTKDGLNRYNGNSVKIFKSEEDNPYSLGNNTVWSLLELPDGKIWAGTDRGIYIYDPLSGNFSFFDKETVNGGMIKNSVSDMKLDNAGNVWIACNDLYRYSTVTDELEVFMYMMYEYEDDKHFLQRTWAINIDKDDQVWISIFHGGVRKFNPVTNQFNYYGRDSHGKDFTQSLISKSININNNQLLIGSFNDGMRMMDKASGEIYRYKLGNGYDDANLYIREMNLFSDKNVWIGTESGLYIHNVKTKQTKHLYHNINDPYSLSDNAIYSMYEDREGGIWIGTYFGGVSYCPLPYIYFENHYPVSGQNSISGERVSGMCEDKSGNLWIGTEDAGLNRFNLKSGRFEHFNPNNSECGLNYHNIHDILADGDKLWIATYSHGINVLDLRNGKWTYYEKGEQAGMLNNNDIFALYKDSGERIWVGTSSSAFLYDRENDEFILLEDLQLNFISDIIEDSSGQIWFSTYNNGVYCYNPRTQIYKNYSYDPEDSSSICYFKITCMHRDSKDRLWFGSESNGICMFDESTQKFIRYGMKDGFSNNVIYKILDDNDENLWLSSNSGLMRFNPGTGNIRIFTQNNGLPGNQFNYKSGYKDSSGRLYFGSINGLISFHPTDFKLNECIPPVVITEFNLLNNELSFTEAECDISNITLKHNQSSFSIDFAALSYIAPEMNKYAYKMEGLEEEWNFLATSQKIIYSNLPHGKYTFRVKASNNDGLWNEEGDSVVIIITPPFWKTHWAYMLYVFLITNLLVVILYYYKKKIEKDNQQKQQIFENEKEKEIYTTKIEFFTNVAHEIRTPLSLIKGPLEYIIKTEVEREELQTNLLIMEKNTNRLLDLINQLLDFRKTESHGFSLTFTLVNVNELVKETYIRFKPLARQKGLEFNLSLPSDIIQADIDKEAIIKVISNLFTNGIKYAQSKILVELSTRNDEFYIQVKSDGKLIPEELKEKIFEPFFQIKEENIEIKSGSGIGLALVRSLIELHEGKAFLDTNHKTMNCFIVTLPIKQENVFRIVEREDKKESTEKIESEYLDPIEELVSVKEKNPYTLLVVEDNKELLEFLVERLQLSYTVFKARNGLEAIEYLDKEIINLVITDIMMPQMDGFELCERIKQNTEHSHIPVIMLTAKTNIQNKIAGLESGADAYIEKPFSIEHLYAQISNLLDNRKKLREVFVNSPFAHTGTIALTRSDEQFLNRLTEIIHRNISNSEFTVDLLAEELYMSRSSLLRKIKGISESTPNDFIRLVRLKKAAEILKEGDYKVNEVCYLVGFSSTSYFSKAFQKQFGVLPKDFAKNFRRREE